MAKKSEVIRYPSEVVYTETTSVSCDGGGSLGHPKVFLEMGKNNEVECPYCDRLFKLESH